MNMDKYFPDYSARTDANELLKAELEAAGIPVVELPYALSGIPSSNILGSISLNGKATSAQWQFIRGRRYWQCDGPGLPPEYAEKLHASHGEHLWVQGMARSTPSECFGGFAVGHYDAVGPAGLKALAETISRVLADAKARQLQVTDDDIKTAAGALVTEWVFPGETCHTPDVVTMAQADKLGWMLRERMKALVAQGVNPLKMSIAELLPGVKPHEIELTEADFC
jgi:hypothetical protein